MGLSGPSQKPFSGLGCSPPIDPQLPSVEVLSQSPLSLAPSKSRPSIFPEVKNSESKGPQGHLCQTLVEIPAQEHRPFSTRRSRCTEQPGGGSIKSISAAPGVRSNLATYRRWDLRQSHVTWLGLTGPRTAHTSWDCW